jgi:hypothetical protein
MRTRLLQAVAVAVPAVLVIVLSEQLAGPAATHIYNVLNAAAVLSTIGAYGPASLQSSAVMAGRTLIRCQLDS